jgi:outer membrane protein
MAPQSTLRHNPLNKMQNKESCLKPSISSFPCRYHSLPTLLLLLTICSHPVPVSAQQSGKITLAQALALAMKDNKTILHARLQEDIAREDIKEKQELKLPEVDFHGSYARITDLTEFKHGLGDKAVTQTIPVIADLTASAKMPLYTGGKIKYSIKKAEQESDVAALRLQKAINDISIEVTGTFLRVYKMMELQKLILENIKEEEDRLHEVKAFRAHGTVTKNEVLRAELQLSDMQLALMTNKRNIAIGIHDLQTLLQLPEDDTLEIDTSGVLTSTLHFGDYEMYLHAALQKEEMQMARRQQEIRETELRITKGNYYPSVHLFASYGANYPNYMFFPPNPYLYTLGKVGVEATFSISGLYKNRTKMHMAHKQAEAQQVQTDIVKNRVTDEVFRQYMQYQDIHDKIAVTEKAVRQASENYRIIKVKYLNQLALITDMIDADNELLQSRFNMVSTRIDAVMKYHELLHASGLLHQ